MAGFSSVTGLESIVNADNASFDGTSRGGAMTLDGQLWIGSTSGRHVRVGTLTAGTGISITNASGSITIAVNGAVIGQTITGNTGGAISPVLGNWNLLGSALGAGSNPVSVDGSGNTLAVHIQRSQAIASTDLTKVGLAAFSSSNFAVDANGFVTIVSGGFPWTDTSGAFSPLKENGYFITATATGTLPAAPAQGDTIRFFVDHATQVLTIQATAGKIIRFGSAVTAAAGTAVSTAQGDSVDLVYRASNTCWCAVAGFSGSWSLT